VHQFVPREPRRRRRGFCLDVTRTLRVNVAQTLLSVLFLAACTTHEPAPKQTPQRIVTLAPNVTEMVIALGAGERIAGTDDFSADAMPTRKLPRVGGLQPNIEKIVATRPDLVIANAAGLQPNLGRSLATVHIPLLVVTNERIDDIAKSMTSIATALGIDSKPAVAALNASLSRQRRTRTNPPRVMLAVWTDPLFVAGRNTFADDLITLSGATNAVEVNGWPQYSLESFVAHPPDLLLYPSHSVTSEAVRALLTRAGTKNVVAIAVDENLFTRPGPRVGEAATQLNAILDGGR
jgi:iron complex transport system substrate-binding protein